jgi:WD40 repeat protein
MKLLISLLILFSINIFAKDITPYKYIKASEAVSDFVKVGDTLIIATEEGMIDIYDLKKEKLIDQIVLEKHKNILGDDIRSLVVSADYIDGKLIFIVRLLSTLRELYVYENSKLTKILDETQHLALQKVKFIDANTVMMATMDNELILFDLKTNKAIYKKQLNLASFSDFTFSEDKKYLYTADETPQISKIAISTGNIEEVYNKANKRDVFSIDYKNGLLISGGKDKRVILYKTPKIYKMTKGKFFIYSVALNPDATMAAFVKNEDSEISVIDTRTLEEKYVLKGHKQTLIKIHFYSSNELITADEANKLMFWKLK